MSHLKQQRENLIRAINRTEARLDEIREDFIRKGTCCLGCYSAEWRELATKQERRRAWLAIVGSTA